MPDRPNIVLIHSDQHRYDCVAAHGHPLLQTPNLDRLCREGTDFAQAYTPAPICSPARASLITGQWPTQHGCMSIPATELYRPIDSPDTPLLPRLLSDAGYRLAHIGKWHGETLGKPPTWGVDDFISEYDDYENWRTQHGLPTRQRKNGWFGEVDPTTDAEHHRVAWGAGEAMRCMENYHAEGRPFFVRWDPSEPHLPNLIPSSYEEMYPPDQIEPWPSFADTLEGKPWIQSQQRRNWDIEGWTWDQFAPIVSRYLAEITLLDVQIGRILDKLEDLGVADNTLIIYTTDHGDLCGGHGMMDKHFMMYDDVVRVPLIMRWPSVTEPGYICKNFVINELDIATTFCIAAGVPVPNTFSGQDLAGLLTGNVTPRDMAFSQYQGCQFGLYSERMARDTHWKYVWNATAEDELYNLDNDPGELKNCANDPSCAASLTYMRRRLGTWMESINDPLCNKFTHNQFFERS